MKPLVGELRTPRLRLRTWTSDDAAAMAAINRDPDVTEYLNRPVDDDAVAAFYQLVTDHWERHGFGFYAVESTEADKAGAFLGFVGVAYPSFLPALAHRPELGWRLGRGAWGRGLATEAAQAVCALAFKRLDFDEVIAIIHPANLRSQRVATKLGMAIEQQVENPVLSMLVDVWSLAPRRRPGVR